MAAILDLTKNTFTIEYLLNHEAEKLCGASPRKDKPKDPNASTSQFTQQSKEGFGPGHAVVRHWPAEKTHAAWGERNRIVLLHENISPSIWLSLEKMDAGFDNIKYRIMATSLSPMRSNDNGNEPAFCNIGSKLLTRITLIASLFFLHQWSKHSDHEDYKAVLHTLQHIGNIQVEYTSTDTDSTIIHDIASLVPWTSPIPILKELSGTSNGAVATMVNTKKTGNREKSYQGFSSNISETRVTNVDQVIDLCVQKASSSPGVSIADLKEFLSTESGMTWPEMATSHLAQVRLVVTFVYFLLTWIMKMTYELDVCVSSLGVFSSLWGFHRVGLLVYPPEGTKILYISDNLAAHTTSPNDRLDPIVNQKVVKDLFFLTISAFLLTYGERMIPPHLRDDHEFMSYFRG
jgi:hypothetical protein